MRMRRAAAIVLAGVVASIAAPVPAQALGPGGGLDTVTVSGYNFEFDQASDVVAGDQFSALRLTYTAGRPLQDGTIRIVLPEAQWAAPLRARSFFEGDSPFDPSDLGVVSVVPNEQVAGPADACRGESSDGKLSTSDWSVALSGRLQIISIAHVSCASDAQFIVRIKGITAPATAGVALLPVLVDEPGRWPRVAVGRVRVMPAPKVSLSVTAPGDGAEVSGQPFFVLVSAAGPVGAAYAGSVALASDPVDCTQSPPANVFKTTIHTGLQSGVLISLSAVGTYRLRAYDIANKAVPAISSSFVVSPAVNPVGNCPASFH